MSKRQQKFDANQLNIFEYLSSIERSTWPLDTEGQFKIVDRLRAAMRSAIKNSPLSVHQIAGEMSHLLDTSITADQIYSWTRRSDEVNGRPNRYIPAEYLPAFCHVTGCNDPLVVMGRMVGLFVLPGPEALRAEIQKEEEARREISDRIRQRRALLSEMESRS